MSGIWSGKNWKNLLLSCHILLIQNKFISSIVLEQRSMENKLNSLLENFRRMFGFFSSLPNGDYGQTFL